MFSADSKDKPKASVFMSHHNYRGERETQKCCCHHLTLSIIWVIAMGSRMFANMSETLDFMVVQRGGTSGGARTASGVQGICFFLTSVGSL